MTHFKSVIELLDNFKDEQTCIDYLEQKTWNGKPTCPYCGCDKFYVVKGGYRCKEKGCCKRYNIRTNSIFECSNVPLRTWFAAIYLCTAHKKGISSVQLATDLNISQKSAWFLAHRIRNTFFDNDTEMMKGTVEADETYVGGKNKNRHKDKKVENSQGRSLNGKTAAVVGILERGGKVKTFVVPNTEAEILHPLIEEYVDKDATLVTDAYVSYTGLKAKFNHIVVKHKDGGYVTKVGDYKFHTQNIENFWSLFKRGYIGIYHYMSGQHMYRYMNEFGYRYNSRTVSSEERFADAMTKAANNRLTYKGLIGK